MSTNPAPENPQAFPHWSEPWGGKPKLENHGMTLRDYFAAAALSLSEVDYGVGDEEKTALIVIKVTKWAWR